MEHTGRIRWCCSNRWWGSCRLVSSACCCWLVLLPLPVVEWVREVEVEEGVGRGPIRCGARASGLWPVDTCAAAILEQKMIAISFIYDLHCAVIFTGWCYKSWSCTARPLAAAKSYVTANALLELQSNYCTTSSTHVQYVKAGSRVLLFYVTSLLVVLKHIIAVLVWFKLYLPGGNICSHIFSECAINQSIN